MDKQTNNSFLKETQTKADHAMDQHIVIGLSYFENVYNKQVLSWSAADSMHLTCKMF